MNMKTLACLMPFPTVPSTRPEPLNRAGLLSAGSGLSYSLLLFSFWDCLPKSSRVNLLLSPQPGHFSWFTLLNSAMFKISVWHRTFIRTFRSHFWFLNLSLMSVCWAVCLWCTCMCLWVHKPEHRYTGAKGGCRVSCSTTLCLVPSPTGPGARLAASNPSAWASLLSLFPMVLRLCV